MSAPITAITMPKWGLTMTEGKVVQWLKQPGASFAPGEELLEIETSKITNVVEADAAGTLARIVAPEGTTLPIGALLAVIAPSDTPAAEIDAFVAQFAVVEPAEAAEDATPVAPREVQVLGRTLRCLELGSGDTAGAAAARIRRRSQHVDVQSAGTVRQAAGRWRWSCRDTGCPARTSATGDAALFTDVIEAALTALDVERAHVVGHSMGGALAIALAARQPERIATLTLLAPAGLGPEINGGFIDALRARVAAEGGGGGAAIPGARPVADQSRDGRGVPALQATGRRCAGAGDDRERLVPAGAAGGGSGRDAACADRCRCR